MKLKVLGWKYKNIRGGMRNLSIVLGGDGARISLVQMPNGTGKTTTMELLRAALSGESLQPSTVRNFRNSSEDKFGSFELRLEIDGAFTKVELRFDFENGTREIFTSRAQLEKGGYEEGHLLPENIRRLFTSDLVRLFVFDGELARQFREVSQKRAKDAITALYQLNRLRDLKIVVARLVEAEQQKAVESKAMEQRGITRLQNELSEAETSLKKLTGEATALSETIESLRNLVAINRAEHEMFIARDGEDNDRYVQIKSDLANCETELAGMTMQYLSRLRNPALLNENMHARLVGLGVGLERLRLPKTMSSEFFQELSTERECVCGRPIGPSESRAIIARAGQYLADNQIAVINQMKRAVRSVDAASADMKADRVRIHKLLLGRQGFIQLIDQLVSDIEAKGIDELKKLAAHCERLEDELRSAEERLNDVTSTDAAYQKSKNLSDRQNIALCSKTVEEIETKLATATRTRKFMLQGRVVTGLLDEVERNTLATLTRRVIDQTNSKLEQIIRAERLIVTDIQGALKIESPGFGVKEGVSEGQSLGVAYAYLTSLLSDAPLRLPFIVDSPAVSLDTLVRRQVATIIPALFDQLIMFVISSEREGFTELFYERDDTEFMTVEHSANETTVIAGVEAFRSFHELEGIA